MVALGVPEVNVSPDGSPVIVQEYGDFPPEAVTVVPAPEGPYAAPAIPLGNDVVVMLSGGNFTWIVSWIVALSGGLPESSAKKESVTGAVSGRIDV
jgi:hypothetical protein